MRERLKALLRAALTVAEENEADCWPAIQRLLLAFREHVSDPAYRAAIRALLEATRAQKPHVELYPQRKGLVLIASVPVSLREGQAAPAEDAEHEDPEDDEASLTPAGREVLLAEHAKGVEKKVKEFADRCGIGDLDKAMALAARWHDEGKRDRRFQAWLHGSELKALAALGATSRWPSPAATWTNGAAPAPSGTLVAHGTNLSPCAYLRRRTTTTVTHR